jgi:hypothetical protein
MMEPKLPSVNHVDWKVGVEIELMAPAEKSRQTLAERYAREHGGKSQRIFYIQSEPTAGEQDVVENLVLGFKVTDGKGNLVAKCVDDLTLRNGLKIDAPSKPGWYRIISDEGRFLDLITKICNPEDSQDDVLKPLAKLFNAELHKDENNIVVLGIPNRSPVALAPTLPGERERACEVITPPLEKNQREHLASLLKSARDEGFTIPIEAAVHLHFDAAPLKNLPAFANVINFLYMYGPVLKSMVRTNPRCMRLGAWCPELVELMRVEGFTEIPWDDAMDYARRLPLTKFVDFNIANIVYSHPEKQTIEIRILPGSLDENEIMVWAHLFTRILQRCVAPVPVDQGEPLPISVTNVNRLFGQIDLEPEFRDFFLARFQ